MRIHQQVLEAARRIGRERGDWTFRATEIVRALPDSSEASVRTHVASRCCVNAPANHPHRWPYFRRVRRGVYEVVPAWRKQPRKLATAVAERGPGYAIEHRSPPAPAPRRDTFHAVVRTAGRMYVAEGLELALVTQGRTLDELVANLRESVELYLDGPEASRLGFVPRPRLSVLLELGTARDEPST